MATASIVLPVPPYSELTGADAARYVSLREKIGYTQLFSDQRIEINENTTLLRWADLGIVETLADAQELCSLLQRDLPHHEWRIEIVEYPEAFDIVFYGKRYRLHPRRDRNGTAASRNQ